MQEQDSFLKQNFFEVYIEKPWHLEYLNKAKDAERSL